MLNKYKQWIDTYYGTYTDALGRCKEACTEMKRKFPELTVTNGFVSSAWEENNREHWWLKDLEGQIIDPTRMQYRNIEPIEYEEIDDNHIARQKPRKHCPNCGGYFYSDGYLCSEKCEKEYTDYIEGRVAL